MSPAVHLRSDQGKASVAALVIVVLVGTAVLVFGTAGVLGYWSYDHQKRLEFAEKAQVLVEEASAGLSLPLWHFDRDQISRVLNSLFHDPTVSELQVVDAPSGRPTITLVRRADGTTAETQTGLPPEGDLVETRPVIFSAQNLGSVTIAMTTAALEAHLTMVRWGIAGVISVFALSLSAVLWLILWSLVLRPLRTLEAYSKNVVSEVEKPGDAVPPGGLRGEMGVLGANLTQMTVLLKDRYQELVQETNRAKENESRFRTLIEAIPDLVWMKDGDGKYLGCNRSFELFLGIQERDILGKTDWDFFPAEAAASFRENDLLALSVGIPRHNEEWVRYASDGRTALLDTVKTAVWRADGTLIGILGVARDITERKRVEEALAASESNFRNIFDRALEGFFRTTPQGQFLMANPAFAHLLGYPSGEEVTRSAHMGTQVWTNPEDWTRTVDELMARGEIRGWETQFTRLDGTVIWVVVNAKVGSDGVSYWFDGFVLDITDTRRAQDELKAALDFNTTLVDSSPAFFVALETDGRVRMMNRSMLTSLGYDASEVVGVDYTPRFVVPEDTDAVTAALERLAEGAPPAVTVNRIFTRSGSQLTIEWQGVTAYRNGEVDFVFGVGTDITERRRTEAELEHYRKHLEDTVRERTQELVLARDAADAANKSKSVFLANMSHEIRTPMNAVLGFAQLLNRDSGLTDASRAKVRTILKSGEHLLSIINEVLEMSRIESGRVELREATVDFPALLHDLAVMFQLRAEEKGIGFVLELSPELPQHLLIDKGKLQQILINLLGNAVKFTVSGSVTLRAHRADAGLLVVEVIDTGIGMTDDERVTVFTPFVRTAAGEKMASGTGLGLSISQQYALLLGGKIEALGREGGGSCFRLSFPAAVTEAPEQGEIARVPALPADAGYRLLVVDDDETNRAVLRGMLEPFGFEVLEAASGEEAEEAVRTSSPRVVFMDQRMPGRDGRETTRRIRALGLTDPPVVIGFSASIFTEDKAKFVEAGLDGFLAKPFREQELYAVLEQVCGIRLVEASPAPRRAGRPVPTLEKMTEGWKESFFQALSFGNITKIRSLAKEAEERDHGLSLWLQEQTAAYNIEAIQKLFGPG